jgi:hypothetical protein
MWAVSDCLHASEVALGAVGEHSEHLVHARRIAAELEDVFVPEAA